MITFKFYSVPIVGRTTAEVGDRVISTTRFNVGDTRLHELRASATDLVFNLGVPLGLLIGASGGLFLLGILAVVIGNWNHTSRRDEIQRAYTNPLVHYTAEQKAKIDAEKQQRLEGLTLAGSVVEVLQATWFVVTAVTTLLFFMGISAYEMSLGRLMQQQARADRGVTRREVELHVVPESKWAKFRLKLSPF